MKFLLYIFLAAFLFAAIEVKSQPYSNITYDIGTNIEVQSGADLCADDIFINGTYTGTGTLCTGALPIELLSFTSAVNRNNVTLSWVTAIEINNSRFEVERASVSENGNEVWLKRGFVNGNGTTNGTTQYSFQDDKMKAGRYKYRLKQIDYNGSFEYFDLPQVVKVDPPGNFSVGQNYPNPSNPKSKIDYEIPVNGKVTIKLYNMLGQMVSSLKDEITEAGYYTAEFDGTNLSSGVYFYRITFSGTSQNFTKALKMILVK